LPAALLALAISAFAIGCTEFIMMGLLPEVAVAFHVSIPTAGDLISGYALGVVVGAPLVLRNFANTDAALAWLNTNPVQSAGEVAATARNDGSVSMLTIVPPTSPLQRPQQWFYRDFASPNDAVFYLNEAPAQSDGKSARRCGTTATSACSISPRHEPVARPLQFNRRNSCVC
jgi:hypothetical protein